jgi:uncharacterized protein YkwD
MKKILYLITLSVLFSIFINSCSEDDNVNNPVDENGTTLLRTEAKNAFNYLNQVRANPESYSQSIGVDLSGVEPRPALKWNNILQKVAEEKAKDMANRNYFSHTSPEGLGINIMINDAGYTIPADWYSTPSANYFESLASGWGSVSTGEDFINLLIIDEGVPSLGHRKHLLGMGDWNSSLVDCGIGYANNPTSNNRNYVCVIIAKQK